jgi:hypothetical protein
MEERIGGCSQPVWEHILKRDKGYFMRDKVARDKVIRVLTTRNEV